MNTDDTPDLDALIQRHRIAAADLARLEGHASENAADAAMHELTAAEAALRARLAPPTDTYDPTGLGDQLMHNGVLYRRVVDVPTTDKDDGALVDAASDAADAHNYHIRHGIEEDAGEAEAQQTEAETAVLQRLAELRAENATLKETISGMAGRVTEGLIARAEKAEAERDEARSRYNDLDLCIHGQAPCSQLLAAEAALAECRAKALEECAAIGDQYDFNNPHIGQARSMASHIRALKRQEPRND